MRQAVLVKNARVVTVRISHDVTNVCTFGEFTLCLRMPNTVPPEIVAVVKVDNCLVVEFATGEVGRYSAACLHSLLYLNPTIDPNDSVGNYQYGKLTN